MIWNCTLILLKEKLWFNYATFDVDFNLLRHRSQRTPTKFGDFWPPTLLSRLSTRIKHVPNMNDLYERCLMKKPRWTISQAIDKTICWLVWFCGCRNMCSRHLEILVVIGDFYKITHMPFTWKFNLKIFELHCLRWLDSYRITETFID